MCAPVRIASSSSQSCKSSSAGTNDKDGEAEGCRVGEESTTDYKLSGDRISCKPVVLRLTSL